MFEEILQKKVDIVSSIKNDTPEKNENKILSQTPDPCKFIYIVSSSFSSELFFIFPLAFLFIILALRHWYFHLYFCYGSYKHYIYFCTEDCKMRSLICFLEKPVGSSRIISIQSLIINCDTSA